MIERTLWLIESRLGGEITLEGLAASCGVSPYHLSRVFAAATGRSVMRYVRDRRMSAAAERLAAGGESVLSVALDHGYGSHEAFSRAFRRTFGVTPDTVRRRRTIDDLVRQEPIAMTTTIALPEIGEPRFETAGPLRIAGIAERYDEETLAGIPAQWARFAPHIGHVPGQIGGASYGVCRALPDGGIEYLCGVRIGGGDAAPRGLVTVDLPAARHAVFTHRGHISALGGTVRAIWTVWLPRSGLKTADQPDFELYDERFDPRTGEGEVEIWIPLRA